MLQPKRVRYRKTFRAVAKGNAHSGNTLNFGDFGMQAVEGGLISARQIEAARRVLVRHLPRDGRMWIRIFPDRAVTKHPAETRMGGGKGMVEYWAALVKPGHIMYELSGLKEDVAKKAVELASHKLSVAVRFVSRQPETREAA
ncbi:MAG: 50S ribosomal protein L16 [Dehalococcoidia bacterium]|nr:50S ribosomal protein L16 [Dehalococcoidia bacterium]